MRVLVAEDERRLARATAEAHGGSASLEDAGPGLRAVVRLPLTAGG